MSRRLIVVWFGLGALGAPVFWVAGAWWFQSAIDAASDDLTAGRTAGSPWPKRPWRSPPSFGLGAATRAESVEVRWPSGRVDRHADLAADRAYKIREGDPQARPLPGWTRPATAR